MARDLRTILACLRAIADQQSTDADLQALADDPTDVAEGLGYLRRIHHRDVRRDEDARFVRMILEHIPDMIFVKDAKELRFVRFNRAGERLLGRDREELLGRNDYAFFPREEADFFTAKDREVLERGELVDIPEESIHTPTGIRYLHTKKIPVPGRDGKPAYLLGISEDVTVAKLAREDAERAHAETRQAQEELRVLLDRFPGAVWTTDDDLRIVSVAGAGADRIGLDASKLGTPMADSVPAAASAIAALHTLTDLGAATYEFHHGARTYQVSVSPLEEHERPQVIWVALDVTERRKLDAEVLRSRLERGQRLEQLGLLAGSIAHDFNNLLTAMLGNASLALRRLPQDVEAREHVEALVRTAEKAGELTHQLLAYAGKGRFTVEPLDLSELVGRLAHLVRSSVSKRAVLSFELPTGLPPILGDASQIKQVILNLATNASDALGKGDGHIAISTSLVHADRATLSRAAGDEELPEGDYVALEVRDTGHGMDEETLGRIFDPFFSTKERGQGLGLAATLGLVRQHHGAVLVDSAPGGGTTLRVLFRARPAASAIDVERAVQMSDGARRTARVLVVDDELVVRTVATVALTDAGYDVLAAADGVEALDCLGREGDSIDVAVLDLTMPRMSGAETLREIRRQHPHVRVILSSGYAEPEALATIGARNRARFLQKPYRPADVVAAVDDAIRVSHPPPLET